MRFVERKRWGLWVTPKYLRKKKIHRWCIFPHSFTNELVHGLINEWKLAEKDMLLDPFCGAGTTLLAAKEKRIPARGYDLSPFAVFASQVKLENYNKEKLRLAWVELKNSIKPEKWNGTSREYPDLITKALPNHLLGAFDYINNVIGKKHFDKIEKQFFRMALLAVLPKYSRAVATGGWLKWIDKYSTIKSLPRSYEAQVELMLEDLPQNNDIQSKFKWKSKVSDARFLPDKKNTFSAVITSPPYPNRHDYTRVFGVELMFGFLNWKQTRNLRYQSFESHPESHPKRPNFDDYHVPTSLVKTLERIKKSSVEERIAEMISGYFIDIHLSLREIKRVCKQKAKIAFVVGNAQYGGIPIMVDTLTAEIGKNLGLKCNKIIAARFRGNSAQQMSIFGRRPSRESIVVLTNS